MKKKSYILLLLFLLFLPLSIKAKPLTLISPKTGAVVSISNRRVRKWWKRYKTYSSAKYKKKKELTTPKSFTLNWEGTKGSDYFVYVSNKPSFKKHNIYYTKDESLNLSNLRRNKDYYWKVVSVKDKKRTSSETGHFKTENVARIINVPKVFNIRDIGGYDTADGKKVKQGMVFRAATLDKINEDGKTILKEKLNVKTDLDLRRVGEGKCGKKSPAGLKYINIPGTQYEHLFEEGEKKSLFIKEIKVFANKRNYPIVFHCSYGRDRTGTLAFVLNGLLGVSKKNLFRDYELTFLTCKGTSKVKEKIKRFENLYNLMASYKDSKKSLSYNIECYLKDNGVTQKEINSIKKLLLVSE